MKHFLEIIKENGYKPYRCSCVFENQNPSAKEQNKYILEKYKCIFTKGDKNNGTFYFQPKYSENDFSSMRVGGLATFYVKDKDFKNAIIWGLNEHGKPPILISPKPNIFLKRFNKNNEVEFLNEYYQDAIFNLFKVENHQFIFDNLFTNHLYYYDLTKNPVN
jgi:hypothetical protein